ncbi:uncharacterized protein LOC112212333 [Bombus impatiens]|uniref:Uncharacterized protein LOC112212333 n=1 Tax=Bombus impatiens TaxID=132113 RepID=A0A6P8LND9_BOMIM|nr:uncharacterized protein LOC112212333 [Bombus impatiens]
MAAVLVQCLLYRFTTRSTSILNSVLKVQNNRDYLYRGRQHSYRELWTIATNLIPSAMMKCYTQRNSKLIAIDSTIGMPRSRRRHRTRSHSRARSHSAGSLSYEHKRRRIDYESPRSKGTYR